MLLLSFNTYKVPEWSLAMDHIGKKARVESAFLVQKKMKELGENLPAILTGDFNVDQTHE